MLKLSVMLVMLALIFFLTFIILLLSFSFFPPYFKSILGLLANILYCLILRSLENSSSLLLAFISALFPFHFLSLQVSL